MTRSLRSLRKYLVMKMSNSNRSLYHAYIVRAEGEAAALPRVRALLSEMLCSSAGGRPCGECTHCIKVSRGIHPDITVITKLDGKKEIQVDQIREAVFSARLMPNEAERRVIVINGAHEMNINAQNSLLKLLEEPPKHIAILLLTNEPGSLLPTVRSRCRVLEAGGVPDSIPEEMKALAARYIELALAGGEGLLELSFELSALEKNSFKPFIEEALGLTSRRLRVELETGGDQRAAKRLREIIDAVKKAGEYLDRNVSTLHISALLCVFSEPLD